MTEMEQSTNLLKIRRVLRELGVPEHLSGHGYLEEAALLCLKEPQYLRRITGGLYPAVADKFRVTASQVDRAIRHAIETAWLRCDARTMNRYFGNTVNPQRGKPMNSEFVARLTSAVRLGE